MGFLDRLLGRDDADREAPRIPQTPRAASASAYRGADGTYAPPPAPSSSPAAAPTDEDAQAIERYRYLLRTAPPATIEQVHAEAFAQLTDAQRQQVLADLSATLPDAERPRSDDPAAMARAATRAEYREPGFMERTFGNRPAAGAGGGFGSMLGASMLGTIGGYVVGSALVSAFLAPTFAADPGTGDTTNEAGADTSADTSADAGGDWGGDAGGFGDFGGDFGGFDGF